MHFLPNYVLVSQDLMTTISLFTHLFTAIILISSQNTIIPMTPSQLIMQHDYILYTRPLFLILHK